MGGLEVLGVGLTDLGGAEDKVVDESGAWRVAARCREATACGEVEPAPAMLRVGRDGVVRWSGEAARIAIGNN